MINTINLSDYAVEIHLCDPFEPDFPGGETKTALVDGLLGTLAIDVDSFQSYFEKRRALHGKLNTLPPGFLDPQSVRQLDQLLQLELREKEITDASALITGADTVIGQTAVALWQGDIATLKIDAIVNAANNQLLGCFLPNHACIDNVIHSGAGVQLRDDCNRIMEKQGTLEPTGRAKITRAYHLPSKFVLHTVGPIVEGGVSEQNRNDLHRSYISCLEICKGMAEIRSVAFCCISTGVFGYPNDEAAQTAFETVSKWLRDNPGALDLVVFNVFLDKDRYIYEALMREK